MKKPLLLLIRELTPINSSFFSSHTPVVQDLLDNGFFHNQLFSFVGVYYSSSTETTVIGYPKYIPEFNQEEDPTEIINHVDLVCKVVEKARPFLDKSLVESSYDFNPYYNQIGSQWVSAYDLATFILHDYMEYGIYYERTREYKHNGKGNINWRRTISCLQPIIDKEVIYLKTINQFSKEIHSQIITPLHIWIVNRCANLLKGLGKYSELETPEVSEEFNDDNLNQYIPYLLGKLSYVFNDREIRLLKALSSWCEKSTFYRNRFGITTFNRIWEYASKQVFGNIDDTKSGPPKYVIQGTQYIGKGDSIPDILRVFIDKESRKGYIGILDAKYYLPTFAADLNYIYGAPSNADISKQISYYRYLRQQYPGKDIMFTNAFLLPCFSGNINNLYQHIGYAINNDNRNMEIELRMEGIVPKETMKNDQILLFQINPSRLFEACLNEIRIDNAEFIDSFILPFQEIET